MTSFKRQAKITYQEIQSQELFWLKDIYDTSCDVLLPQLD